MPNPIAHFSINADDVPRARKFYEQVFGWTFSSWGPPGFFLIETGTGPTRPTGAIGGALQERRDIVPGRRANGFECTIAVDDVDATVRAIEKAGGTIVMPKVAIVGVGRLVYFEDTEGNVAGAMEYDATAG